MTRDRRRSQSLVEFSMTIGMLMFMVVATTQVAIILHYRSSLDTATQEGAFEGGLAGSSNADAEAATKLLWTRIEPGGGPIQVTATRSGNLVTVTANASAPALIPLPAPPFTSIPITSRSVHTIEVFEPGSAAP